MTTVLKELVELHDKMAEAAAREICEKYMYGSSPELCAEIEAIISKHQSQPSAPSPVPSQEPAVPVSELEKLVEEWRKTANRDDADKRYAGHLRKFADSLSAVIRGTKT